MPSGWPMLYLGLWTSKASLLSLVQFLKSFLNLPPPMLIPQSKHEDDLISTHLRWRTINPHRQARCFRRRWIQEINLEDCTPALSSHLQSCMSIIVFKNLFSRVFPFLPQKSHLFFLRFLVTDTSGSFIVFFSYYLCTEKRIYEHFIKITLVHCFAF